MQEICKSCKYFFARLARSCTKSCTYLASLALENYLAIFSCRFLQHFSYFARKASFLVQDLQDLVQELASFARKILARFGYFLQDGFYWDTSWIRVNDVDYGFAIFVMYNDSCQGLDFFYVQVIYVITKIVSPCINRPRLLSKFLVG